MFFVQLFDRNAHITFELQKSLLGFTKGSLATDTNNANSLTSRLKLVYIASRREKQI
jgi:hypothetical protein